MSPNLHNNLGNIDFNKPVLRWRKLWLIILPKSRRNSSESHWTPWFHWNQLWRTVWPLAFTGISLFQKIGNTFQIVLECGSISITGLCSLTSSLTHILTNPFYVHSVTQAAWTRIDVSSGPFTPISTHLSLKQCLINVSGISIHPAPH